MASDSPRVYASIARELVRLGQPEQAMSLASHLRQEEPEVWAEVVAEAASRFARAGHEPCSPLESIISPYTNADNEANVAHDDASLEHLANALMERRLLEEALRVADAIRDGLVRAFVLARIAGRLAQRGVERARAVVDRAWDVAMALPAARAAVGREDWKALLGSAISGTADFGKLWLPLSPDELAYVRDRLVGQAVVAVGLLQTEWAEGALAIAERIEDAALREEVVRLASFVLASQGKLEALPPSAPEQMREAIAWRLLEEGKPELAWRAVCLPMESGHDPRNGLPEDQGASSGTCGLSSSQ
jgi:hypothetical protein